MAAGLRTIGVTFLRESAKPEVALLPADAGAAAAAAGPPAAAGDRSPMAELDLRLDGVKLKRFEVPQGQQSAAGDRGDDLRTL